MLPIAILPIVGLLLGISGVIGANLKNEGGMIATNILSPISSVVFNILLILFSVVLTITFSKDRRASGFCLVSMIAKMYTIIRDEKLPIKNITVDNGLEFKMMGIIAKQLNFKVYYCQPYSSFQRDTNENINDIVRRWYKKGTDFSLVSEDKIKTFEWKVNNMRKKYLVIKQLIKCTKKIFKTKNPQLIFHSQEFNVTLKCCTSHVS